ncbi:MAG: alanine--tRNA ligase-related protein [Nanobdellota archaeon]
MEYGKLRKQYTDTFLSFFKEKQYSIESPNNLISENDNTLLFINDTIAPWKNYLATQIPKEGLCLKQPCLRLQGLRDTISLENRLELKSERYIGYFTGLGILVSADDKNSVQEEISELLLQKYKINSNNIKIFARDDMNFLDTLKTHLEVSTEENSEIYYDWQYGLDEIKGKGATFMLKQKDNSLKEIGQLIEIYSGERTLGYEFGFGLETFTSRFLQDETFASWPITQYIEEPHLRFKTLLDNYSCLAAMLSCDTSKFTERHVQELNKNIRNIVLLQDIFGLSSDYSYNVLNKFSMGEFNKETNLNLLNLIKLEEDNLWRFKNGIN